MTAIELARRIDHTILKPETTPGDVDTIVDQALEHHFASVCVSPFFVQQVARRLKGSDVLTCTVSSFPHGAGRPAVKAIESTVAVKEGADEVDVVAHLPFLAGHDVDAARAELIEVAKSCRAARRDILIKVIIEAAYLLSLGTDRGEQAIATACRAIRESGCDFVKTSTGFHPAGGASETAIRLMRKYGEGLLVKASGGIRNAVTARTMLDAGADRLGLSSSVAILAEWKQANGKEPAAVAVPAMPGDRPTSGETY